jgi:hypothetical protein
MNDIVYIVIAISVTLSIVVGVSVYQARMQRKRREAIEQFAQELGLTFSAEDTEQFRSRMLDFQLFKEGRAQRVYNLLRAEAEGVRMSVFDYQFTTGSGKHQQTHRQTILAVESNELHMPPMSLRQENFFDTIASAFGFRDIDIDGQPEFSRRFMLKSPNEELTRKLFDAEVCEYFVTRRDVLFEASRNRLAVYRRGKIVKPELLKALLADGLQLFNLFSARVARLEQTEKAERRS